MIDPLPAAPEHPLLMQGSMARSTLARIKTQTRRLINPQPPDGCTEASFRADGWGTKKKPPHWLIHPEIPFGDDGLSLDCPYGLPGHRLWVRENHQLKDVSPHGWPQCLVGYSDGTTLIVDPADDDRPRLLADDEAGLTIGHDRWKPSIHMPRWASRILLEVTEIRAQRLQDISEKDAIAEGIFKAPGIESWTYHGTCFIYLTAREAFRALWNSIHLQPKPVYTRDSITGKKVISHYLSHPWSLEDFVALHPDVPRTGLYRGKPVSIVPNPWIWAVTFRLLLPASPALTA